MNIKKKNSSKQQNGCQYKEVIMTRIFTKVTTVNTYVIEVDSNKWNDPKKVAEDLAVWQSINGQGDGYIDDYGYVTRDECLPLNLAFEDVDERKATEGLNIKIISENKCVNVDSDSVEENKSKEPQGSINFTSDNHC
jgi:hypothetical protein